MKLNGRFSTNCVRHRIDGLENTRIALNHAQIVRHRIDGLENALLMR